MTIEVTPLYSDVRPTITLQSQDAGGAIAARAAAESARLSAEEAAASEAAAEADRVQTGLDRVQTGQDRAQTSLDASATAQDRVQTGQDRTATGADRVQTGQDRSTASSAATVATTQAGIAINQAQAAAVSAGEAADSADTATAAASVAGTQSGIATTKASEAAASAQSALSSKNSATSQAETATTKASEAAASAAAALISQTSASGSAQTATTKASEASASAQTATAQAGVATTKSNEASASAQTASTQAGIASTKASEASGSAQTATAQAGTATTKASEASASAQTASTKASEASGSAAAAAGSASSALESANSAEAVLVDPNLTSVVSGLQALSVSGEIQAVAANLGAVQGASENANIAATQAGNAMAAALTAQTAANNAVAVVTGGTASLTASPGRMPIADATGKIDPAYVDLLAGVSTPLHRSPNAITAMFLYDTSKDSDGGAWTEKCQHTSWYNETLSGKWLGAQVSELEARCVNSSLGPELITNGDFSSGTTGWTGSNATLTTNSGALRITCTANGSNFAYQAINVISGKVYKITATQTASSTAGGRYIGAGTSQGASQLGGFTFGAIPTQGSLYVTATSSTLYLSFIQGSASLAGEYVEVDNISVKEVTAAATAANDYFQLTSDGKFYALSKNLLTSTATLATQTQWLTAGTYTLSSTTGSSGSVAISGAATASHTAGTPTTFTVATSGNVTFTVTGSVLTAQCELGSVATTYSANASTTRYSEVFRGNKRSFPKVAAIVAEATSVTIYDMTEAGRPMWMRFIATATATITNKYLLSGANSLAALNGRIYVGGTATNATGLTTIDFAKDMARLRLTSGYVWNGNLSTRNAVGGYTTVDAATGGIVNAAARSVAAVSLSDAPVDPVTGLTVPTVAVATAGGISIIQNSGTIRNSSSTTDFLQITLTPQLLSAGAADAVWYYAATPNALGASFSLTTKAAAAAPDFNVGNTGLLKAKGRANYARTSDAVVQMLRNRQAAVGLGLSAKFSDTYSTGWMVGDIRRAYLASTLSGSVGPASELISNNTFTNTTGWSTPLGLAATLTTVNNELVVTNSGVNYGAAVTTITTDVGKAYLVAATIRCGATLTGTHVVAANNYASLGTQQGSVRVTSKSNTAVRFVFTATATTTYIAVNNDNNNNNAEAYLNVISVTEAIPDRSYKAASANITGTLTATAVNTNTDLVAYSGFSAANYLREPYSSDLDFGTGEWTCSAWVNTPVYMRKNLLLYSENFAAGWVLLRAIVTANTITQQSGQTTHGCIQQNVPVQVSGPVTVSVEAKPNGKNFIALAESFNVSVVNKSWFNVADGTVGTRAGNVQSFSIVPSGDGYYRCSITVQANYHATTQSALCYVADTDNSTTVTDSGGVYVRNFQAELGSGPSSYQKVESGAEIVTYIADRSFSSGAGIRLCVTSNGLLTATAFDGTTTRTVTTTGAYNRATWIKVRVNYTTDGRLAILVNGVVVATTTGAPLLTLNNSNAVLTIGNSFALDAPFPGSMALLKFSASVPTAEQALFMHEQEKHLFASGAKCVLPANTNVLDLSYDEETDTWSTLQAAQESTWSGLVRTSTQAPSAGSFSRSAAGSGNKLLARTTTNPGVDIQMPSRNLRAELRRRREALSVVRDLVTLDYFGGFTATTTLNSTSLTSVASSLVPSTTNLIGCAVSGTGIPASTFITGVSGTTIFISKPATANGSNIQISTTDFNLPVGYTEVAVLVAGALRREGSTADFTRLHDGFRETIRFAVAPGHNAWVQIQAVREVT